MVPNLVSKEMRWPGNEVGKKETPSERRQEKIMMLIKALGGQIKWH